MMKRIAVFLAAGAFASFASAYASDGPVRLGVIADQSGPYADLVGTGFILGVQMAVEDFGGKVLDRPIEVLSADDQAKPDIAVTKAREWYDRSGAEAIFEGSNSATAVALQRLGAERKKVTILTAGSSVLTNEDCSPYGVQYVWDTYSLASGTAGAVTKDGAKTWFFLTADYVFGKAMEANASSVVKKLGGSVVGQVRHPQNSSDFASFILAAQQSGADAIGLANAGHDTQNAVRQAVEFGVSAKQKIVPLLIFDTDIKSMGLNLAQGLVYTTGYYWDFDDQTREFAKRFFARHKAMPTMAQAGAYSAALHYLKAVQKVGSFDADKVMATMKSEKINDFFGRGGYIRADGRMIHDMYLVQAKAPAESKEPWDIAKVLKVIPGEEAFAPLSASTCPYLKH